MALNASTMPEFFGGFFLLAMLAILLYGILSFQTFAYSVRGNELQFAKAVIVSVWMLETIHSALVIHITYNYTIDDFDHAGNMRDIIWVTGALIIIQMLITLFIQSFYLHRVYLLGERSLVVPLVVGVALLGRFGIGLASAVYTYRFQTWLAYRHSPLTSTIFISVLGLSAGLDILITLVLIYYLRKPIPSKKTFDNVLRWLIACVITTGVFPMAASIATLITFLLVKNSVIFVGFGAITTKLYAISLLSNLIGTYSQCASDNSSMYQRSIEMSTFRAPPGQEIMPTSPVKIFRVQEITKVQDEEADTARQHSARMSRHSKYFVK